MSVKIRIDTFNVKPSYRMAAVQWPEGGSSQREVKELLEGLGLNVSLWDGVVEEPDEPAPDGTRYQWKSAKVEGVYGSAQIGDWIVVTLGSDGVAYASTHKPEQFNALYMIEEQT